MFYAIAAYGHTTAPPNDPFKFSFSTDEGNWRQRDNIRMISSESILLSPMEAQLGKVQLLRKALY